MRAKQRTLYGQALVISGLDETGEAEMRWGMDELATLHESDPNDGPIASSFSLSCCHLAEFLYDFALRPENAARSDDVLRETRDIARRGLEVASRLLETARDMQVIYVEYTCRKIITACDDELR